MTHRTTSCAYTSFQGQALINAPSTSATYPCTFHIMSVVLMQSERAKGGTRKRSCETGWVADMHTLVNVLLESTKLQDYTIPGCICEMIVV